MIELKNGCIGVRCPICGNNHISQINRFQLASGIMLNCPHCNARLFSVKKKNASEVIELNCFACGETHTYTVSSKAVFSDGCASFGCKTNLIDVLFIGSYADIQLALDQLSSHIDSLTDKYYENFEKLYGSLSVAALRILEKKAQDKRIVCLCGNHEINLRLEDNQIILSCPVCGSSEHICVATEDDILKLNERRSILLK